MKEETIKLIEEVLKAVMEDDYEQAKRIVDVVTRQIEIVKDGEEVNEKYMAYLLAYAAGKAN